MKSKSTVLNVTRSQIKVPGRTGGMFSKIHGRYRARVYGRNGLQRVRETVVLPEKNMSDRKVAGRDLSDDLLSR